MEHGRRNNIQGLRPRNIIRETLEAAHHPLHDGVGGWNYDSVDLSDELVLAVIEAAQALYGGGPWDVPPDTPRLVTRRFRVVPSKWAPLLTLEKQFGLLQNAVYEKVRDTMHNGTEAEKTALFDAFLKQQPGELGTWCLLEARNFVASVQPYYPAGFMDNAPSFLAECAAKRALQRVWARLKHHGGDFLKGLTNLTTRKMKNMRMNICIPAARVKGFLKKLGITEVFVDKRARLLLDLKNILPAAGEFILEIEYYFFFSVLFL